MLGHLEALPYGLTPYVDRDLFQGLQSFQRTHDLIDAAVMKPDGPTTLM